jgi:hypothetical protein
VNGETIIYRALIAILGVLLKWLIAVLIRGGHFSSFCTEDGSEE